MSRRFEISVVVSVDAVDEEGALRTVRKIMDELEESNWSYYSLQTSVLDDVDEVFPEDD